MRYDIETETFVPKCLVGWLDKIIAFASDYLNLPDIDLTIHFHDEGFHGAAGFADGDEYEGWVIEINTEVADFEELVRTIFHELVHVAQIVTGRYIRGESGKLARWEGNVVKEKNYFDLPWEKEAYENESVMWANWSMKSYEKE